MSFAALTSYVSCSSSGLSAESRKSDKSSSMGEEPGKTPIPGQASPPQTVKGTSSSKNQKRKRKRKSSSSHDKGQVLTEQVLSPPHWTYLSLVPLPPAQLDSLDPPTVRLALLRALSTYLGDYGAAIPVDILAIAPTGSEHVGVLVRVPYEDGTAVEAALSSAGSLSSAVSLRIKRRTNCLMSLCAEDPQELFKFERNDSEIHEKN